MKRRAKKKTAKAKTTKPWKWLRVGASVGYGGGFSDVAKGPFLEGRKWFVALRGVAGFWPVSALSCAVCGGCGQVARMTRVSRVDAMTTVHAKVVRCWQCRGVGASGRDLDLRHAFRRP